MKMRKLTAFLLAAAMTAGMSLHALAEGEITQGTTDPKNTTVKTTVAVKYTVVIPSDITVPFNQENTDFTIEVTEAVLHPQGKITVSTTAAGEMKNASDATSILKYTVKDDKGQAFSSIVFTGIESKTCKVNITTEEWNRAKAGEYSGTTTFTVAYDSGIPAPAENGTAG